MTTIEQTNNSMDFYWVYDIPTWQFYLLTVGFFIGFSLLGAFLFSGFFEKKLDLSPNTNDIVSNFLSISGVFYGITLGLISVATFETFSSVEDTVEKEASALAALYRDTGMLEKPERDQLQETLKRYANYVVDKAWHAQRKGIVPKGGTALIDTFQMQFTLYLP
jgi:Protein of unknown function (DUF4239)